MENTDGLSLIHGSGGAGDDHMIINDMCLAKSSHLDSVGIFTHFL